jgi:hypothetical protein
MSSLRLNSSNENESRTAGVLADVEAGASTKVKDGVDERDDSDDLADK